MTGQRCLRAYGVPPPRAQEDFTDPDSRIMNTDAGFQQCYNGQVAVDEGSQLIVAAELSNVAGDNGALLPMIDQTQCNTELTPQMTFADTGYSGEANLSELERRVLRPVWHSAVKRSASERSMTHHPATARMARWLRTPEGRAHYRRRRSFPSQCLAGSSRCWGSDPSACADSLQRTRSGK